MPQKGSWKSREQVWRLITSYSLFLLSRENTFPKDPKCPCDRNCDTFQSEIALLYGESNARSFAVWWWTLCFPCTCWCTQGPRQCSPECCPSLSFLLEKGLAVSSAEWCYRGGTLALIKSLSSFQICFMCWALLGKPQCPSFPAWNLLLHKLMAAFLCFLPLVWQGES